MMQNTKFFFKVEYSKVVLRIGFMEIPKGSLSRSCFKVLQYIHFTNTLKATATTGHSKVLDNQLYTRRSDCK